MSNDFLRPIGGEGAADWVPEYGGKSGGLGQDCGAAPSPQRWDHPDSHHTH